MLYTVGTFLVKPGLESEFIAAWEAFAKWTSRQKLGGGNGILLQDAGESQRFISFGPWTDEKVIQAWRGTAEFKSFFARAKELCAEVRPATMRLAAQAEDR